MMGKRNAMENKQSEKNHQHTRAKQNTLQINVENRKRKEPKKNKSNTRKKNTNRGKQKTHQTPLKQKNWQMAGPIYWQKG